MRSFSLMYELEKTFDLMLADMIFFLPSLYMCLSVSLSFYPYVSFSHCIAFFYPLIFFVSCFLFLSFYFSSIRRVHLSIYIPFLFLYFSLDCISLSFSRSLSERIISLIFSPLDCIVLLSVRSRYRLVSYARG